MKWRNMLGVNGGKLLTLICAAVVAGCAFADRTANREWVGRNFAPSNLVPRVEALENKTDSETLALGEDSFAECPDAVAIGAGASASGLGTVQLGRGENTASETLRFHSWTVIDSDGKVPQERLPVETDPVFGAWKNAIQITAGKGASVNEEGVAIGENTYAGPFSVALGLGARSNYSSAVGIGSNACASEDNGVALGAYARAVQTGSVQIGRGNNNEPYTLQFRDWRLVEADGTIPKERLPEIEVEEVDPDFSLWKCGRRVVAGVTYYTPSDKPATATADYTVALGGMATNKYSIAIGDGAVAGAMCSVAIGDAAEVYESASVQLGQGKCVTKGTLQFRFTPILTETKKTIDGKKTYIGTLNEKLVIPQLDAAVSNLTARIEALEARIPEGGTE